METQALTIRLPKELYEKLRLRAFEKRTSQTAIITEALAERIAEVTRPPVVASLSDGIITCRTIIPAKNWDDPRRHEAIWDGLRGECEAEAVRQQVIFSGDPGERVSQYIRLFRENGELKCDLGATEWTATDVWLQLSIRTEQEGTEHGTSDQ